MQIDRTTHRLRVVIMGHLSAIGISTPETRELEESTGSDKLVLKLLCSMQAQPKENSDVDPMALGEFNYVPEPIPMHLLGDGVEAAYKWNSFINKAAVVCWSEVEMADEGNAGAGIVQEFSKFWGLNNA